MSTLIVQAMLQAAAKNGLDAGDLLDQIPDDGVQPREDALFRMIGARTGGGTFGLRAAEALERGAFGGLEYAIRSSATLGEGLRTLERFSGLVSAGRRFALRHERDGRVEVVVESEREADILIAEFALGALLLLLRDAAGVAWAPAMVRFRHATAADLPHYQRFFGAPVALEQPDDALVVDREAVGLPLTAADPGLHRVLDRYLRAELDAVDPARSLEVAVRGAILRALPEQNADLDAVAAHVGLSSRVLQKRLQQAGTSFQELLDGVRESLAKRYLVQPTFSLSGAALALGYSDVTAFHRAFKRWTGVTPGDFRRRALRDSERPLNGPDRS